MFVNRRTFSAMLAGAVATPRLAFAQAKDNCALYSGVGGQLTHYEVDFGAATLAKRAGVRVPVTLGLVMLAAGMGSSRTAEVWRPKLPSPGLSTT